jgi:hypothetical protein
LARRDHCSDRLGKARQYYACFKNIYSVESTFVASVNAGVFETDIKRLVVRAQLFPLTATPRLQLASNLVTTIPTGSSGPAVTMLGIISSISDMHINC